MALEFQNVQVVLDEGVDTKGSPKLVTKLTNADNVRWSTPGSVRKRYGLVQHETVSNVKRMFSHNGSLGFITGTYEKTAYTKSSSTYTSMGPVPTFDVDSSVMIGTVEDRQRIGTGDRGKFTIYGDSTTTADGAYQISAWESSTTYGGSPTTTGARFTVRDLATNAVVLSYDLAVASTNGIRCLSRTNNAAIVYCVGTTIYAALWSRSSPGSVSVVTLATSVGAIVHWDADVYPESDVIVVAYYDPTSVAMIVGRRNLTTGATLPADWAVLESVNTLAIGYPNGGANVSVSCAAPSNVWVAWANAAPLIRCGAWSKSAWTASVAPFNTVTAIGQPSVLGMGNDSVYVAGLTYGLLGATGINMYATRLGSYVISGGAAVLLGTGSLYHKHLVSKMFSVNSRAYAMTIDARTQGSSQFYERTAYNTAEVADITETMYPSWGRFIGHGVARQGNATCQNDQTPATPLLKMQTSVSVAGDSRYTTVATSDGNLWISRMRIQDSGRRFNWIERNGVTYLAGASTVACDGVQIVDAAPQWFPTAYLATSAIGGSMGAGSYGYTACYAYTDASGRIHRSAPMTPQVVTHAAGSTNSVLLEVTCPPSRSPQYTSVEVYRTVVSGTVYYLVASVRINYGNYYVSHTDLLSDASLAGRPTLYCAIGTAGEVANYPPPPCNVLEVHKNCLFANDVNNGTLWQSKPFAEGEAVAFYPGFQYRIPSDDPITALCSMDDKLVVWTKTKTFVLFGEPFDRSGNGAGMQVHQVASGSGCVDWRSVVLTNIGAYYLSMSGICLLTRSLQVVYVGADVEGIVSNGTATWTCWASDTANDRSEVRWLFNVDAGSSAREVRLCEEAKSESSPYGKWCTATYNTLTSGNLITDALYIGDQYYVCTPTEILAESKTDFRDAGYRVNMSIETQMFYPGGPLGNVRCKEVAVLGEMRSKSGDHDLVLKMFTDPADAGTADVTTVIGMDPGVAGNAAYPVIHSVKNQLGSGFRVSLTDWPGGYDPTDLDPITGTGEGPEWNSLLLRVGIRPGSRKIAATSRC